MVGRNKEIDELERLYDSDESEFVAVYGRRRVGKTYLVREVFDGRFTFVHTGLPDSAKKMQLAHFRQSLSEYGGESVGRIGDWFEAFDRLKRVVASSQSARKVVFIDEMPWMDTAKSDFLVALGAFWNEWASARKDVLLIVCGSAAAWMVKNLFRNRGGLHNRVTARIRLEPLSLGECERMVAARGIEMTHADIAECYMILGGIPYYWRYLVKGLSVAQNIDRMFFAGGAPLRGEYEELYSSLFKSAEVYKKVVRTMTDRKSGLTRKEIVENSGIKSAGKLSEILETLEASGFIRRYRSPGKSKRDGIYQLIDNFTLFHFRFLSDPSDDEHFWSATLGTPSRYNWRGLAFERLCLQHQRQLRSALGLSAIHTEMYGWRHDGDEVYPEGAQIDLLIDRADNIVNVCEMKFSDGPFAIGAEYLSELERKISVFKGVTGTAKGIHLTLITSSGLVHNACSRRVQSEVVLDELFA